MNVWRAALRELDMLDAAGRPQFSKIIIVVVAVYAMTQGPLSTALGIALLAAAFGRSTFTAFLHRSHINVDAVDVRAIRQRRDPEEGIEEAG